MTIRELEIIKAALEGDVIAQRKSDKLEHPAFQDWLNDSEKLLKKVSRKLFEQKARKSLIDNTWKRK